MKKGVIQSMVYLATVITFQGSAKGMASDDQRPMNPKNSVKVPATDAVKGGELETAVNQTLDQFHRLASEAKGKEYFDLFHTDSIFYGTDATERWSKAQFEAYSMPHFSKGKGWTYEVKERHVSFSEDKKTAWFDERLFNKSYGECRGSGVLTAEGKAWKIRQYNLSFPIPNDLAGEITARIKATSSPVPSPKK